jgi:hypothetical protein
LQKKLSLPPSILEQGPDGIIWFASGNKVFKMDPENLTITDVFFDDLTAIFADVYRVATFKIDSEGNIYIFGHRTEYPAEIWGTLRKLDADFNLIWTADIPVPQGSGENYQLCVDKEHNNDVYISSQRRDGSWLPLYFYGPTKISPSDGTIIWNLKDILEGELKRWVGTSVMAYFDWIGVGAASRGMIHIFVSMLQDYRTVWV